MTALFSCLLPFDNDNNLNHLAVPSLYSRKRFKIWINPKPFPFLLLPFSFKILPPPWLLICHLTLIFSFASQSSIILCLCLPPTRNSFAAVYSTVKARLVLSRISVLHMVLPRHLPWLWFVPPFFAALMILVCRILTLTIVLFSTRKSPKSVMVIAKHVDRLLLINTHCYHDPLWHQSRPSYYLNAICGLNSLRLALHSAHKGSWLAMGL